MAAVEEGTNIDGVTILNEGYMIIDKTSVLYAKSAEPEKTSESQETVDLEETSEPTAPPKVEPDAFLYAIYYRRN